MVVLVHPGIGLVQDLMAMNGPGLGGGAVRGMSTVSSISSGTGSGAV